MFDLLALLLGFFLICIIVPIILVGVKFLYSLATIGQSNNIYNQETDKQLMEDSKEDSEADLAMTSDDEDSWMFPPEFEDED